MTRATSIRRLKTALMRDLDFSAGIFQAIGHVLVRI
jgi:hypothetical protein